MTDEELMQKYQSGSEDAFNQLYRKYSPMVYGYVKRRLRDSEAEDFYQKIWRQLHQKRELYSEQPFAPWFFVLIKNLLIDEYRSLGRRQELKEKLLPSLQIEVPHDQNDLSEILAVLPIEIAELVRKYYLEGIGYEELAEETGMSQTGLRQRLSRALKGIREKVGGIL
jgi:RNA polymerase sigma factor (sigma-70 family)